LSSAESGSSIRIKRGSKIIALASANALALATGELATPRSW